MSESVRRVTPTIAAVLEHDRVLDLGVDDLAVGGDRGERADVAVHDARALADDRRAADRRADDLGAGFDHDAALDRATPRRPCRRSRGSSVSSTRRLLSSSGSFLPVSIHQPCEDLVAHPVAVVDEPLDGVGDLELAAGRRLDRRAPRRGCAGRRGRRRRAARSDGGSAGFSTSCTTSPSVVDHGDAELPRVVDVGEQDLRRERPAVGAVAAAAFGLERVDELRQALLQHVVAEVHDEVVVAEEVAGDAARSARGRAARPGGM